MNKVPNADYIYGLYYLHEGEKVYYYAGITKDHKRREREHSQNKDATYKRGSKDGTVEAGGFKKGKYGEAAQLPEYVFYRRVVEGRYQDGFEVLETVVEGDVEITEAAVMARLIADGHPLQNSKEGEQWARWEKLAKMGVRKPSQVPAAIQEIEQELMSDTDLLLVRMNEVRTLRQRFLDSFHTRSGWKKNNAVGGQSKFLKDMTIHRYRNPTYVEVIIEVGENSYAGTHKGCYTDAAKFAFELMMRERK